MRDQIRIGVIGDFDGCPSHRATSEALDHAIAKMGMDVAIQWLPTEALENGTGLDGCDALCCAPGIPYKSMDGALKGIRYAREKNIPFIGTCGGFQHTVIEYARNVLGWKCANHAEIDPGADCHVITALSCSLAGEPHSIYLKENTRTYDIYGKKVTHELFTCKFGLNPEYQEQLDESGFKVAGMDENGEARVLEMMGKRFYIATLFQPQLSSTPDNPHVLILAYLDAARAYHMDRG